METTRKSGKKLIKEKAFHVIYEAEQEVIMDIKRHPEGRVPADDHRLQE